MTNLLVILNTNFQTSWEACALLLDRFQKKRLSCIENCPYEEVALDKEQEFSCPSCGTKFKIEGMTNETNAGNGC